MDKRLFLLALITIALYAPTVNYGLVYEDRNDPETFSRPWPLTEDWTARWQHPTRVLRDVSFAVSGVEPRQAHLGNVVLHLVNGLLLYAIGCLWLTPAAAVMAAGLFWLHPVQVESVAYISSRADLVATLFLLLTVLAGKRVWLGLLCAVCAVLAKETFAMVLLIPLVVGSWNRAPRLLWGVWAVVAAPVVLYGLMAFGRAPDLYQSLVTLTQLSRLLLLWIWPVNLTVDHDWALITPAVVLVAVCAWMVIGAAAIGAQLPRWSWAVGLIVVFFVPRVLIPLSEGLHEHHLYAVSGILALYSATWVKGTVCAV